MIPQLLLWINATLRFFPQPTPSRHFSRRLGPACQIRQCLFIAQRSSRSMRWQGHKLVINTICSRKKAPAERWQAGEAVASNQREPFCSRYWDIGQLWTTQTSYELYRLIMNLLPLLSSFLSAHQQALLHHSFSSLQVLHGIVTLCLKHTHASCEQCCKEALARFPDLKEACHTPR